MQYRKMLGLVTMPIRRFATSSILRAHIDPAKIGAREVVGHGINGQASYVDTPLFPFPAIRFREINSEFKALKEKEKGDWRLLSIDEKKCLYRVSYCQTFSEMEAPTGEWKSIVGFALIGLSLGLYLYLFQCIICAYEEPKSFTTESKQAQLKRMIALRMNPVTGISSKWDYENNTWK